MALGTGTMICVGHAPYRVHSDPHTFTGGHSKQAPHQVGVVQITGFCSCTVPADMPDFVLQEVEIQPPRRR